MLVCMALVNLMTPGLAFFYGGLVRSSNVLSIMAQNYASMGLLTIIWAAWGTPCASAKAKAILSGTRNRIISWRIRIITHRHRRFQDSCFADFRDVCSDCTSFDDRRVCRSRELWTVHGLHRTLGTLGIFPGLPLIGAVAGWPNKAFGILPVGSSFT